MADVYHVRDRLTRIFVEYFKEVNPEEVTLDKNLYEFNLPDSWLIEYVFELERNFSLDISSEMALKHLTTIRSAARYLARRVQYNY